MIETVLMAKKKSKPSGEEERSKDRHKPHRMGRVRGRLSRQLELLCERNQTDFTEEVNRAVREMLEREGLWPPPGEKKA